MDDPVFGAVPHEARENPVSIMELLGIVVGGALVVFPEPATTATGLAILAGIFAFNRAKADE
jgi:hypothetical protein